MTTWSDVVRFHILNENGGYWIDSTVIVSHAFKQFLINKTQFTFFTPCESNLDYHYISYGQWAIWLMGGVSHFGLFEYICDFYDCYFLNHKKSIDYFLTDDIIFHYYKSNPEFRLLCQNNKQKWNLYYWSNNFNNTFDKKMVDKFTTKLEYSIQKLTYKYDSKIERKNDSLLVWLLRSKNWNIEIN